VYESRFMANAGRAVLLRSTLRIVPVRRLVPPFLSPIIDLNLTYGDYDLQDRESAICDLRNLMQSRSPSNHVVHFERRFYFQTRK